MVTVNNKKSNSYLKDKDKDKVIVKE